MSSTDYHTLNKDYIIFVFYCSAVSSIASPSMQTLASLHIDAYTKQGKAEEEAWKTENRTHALTVFFVIIIIKQISTHHTLSLRWLVPQGETDLIKNTHTEHRKRQLLLNAGRVKEALDRLTYISVQSKVDTPETATTMKVETSEVFEKYKRRGRELKIAYVHTLTCVRLIAWEESMLDFGLSQEHFVDKIEEKSSDLIANESNREEYERNKDKSRRQLIDFWTDIVHTHEIIYDVGHRTNNDRVKSPRSQKDARCDRRKENHFRIGFGPLRIDSLNGKTMKANEPDTLICQSLPSRRHRLKITFESTLRNLFLFWLHHSNWKCQIANQPPFGYPEFGWEFPRFMGIFPGDAIKYRLDDDQWGHLIGGYRGIGRRSLVQGHRKTLGRFIRRSWGIRVFVLRFRKGWVLVGVTFLLARHALSHHLHIRESIECYRRACTVSPPVLNREGERETIVIASVRERATLTIGVVTRLNGLQNFSSEKTIGVLGSSNQLGNSWSSCPIFSMACHLLLWWFFRRWRSCNEWSSRVCLASYLEKPTWREDTGRRSSTYSLSEQDHSETQPGLYAITFCNAWELAHEEESPLLVFYSDKEKKKITKH